MKMEQDIFAELSDSNLRSERNAELVDEQDLPKIGRPTELIDSSAAPNDKACSEPGEIPSLDIDSLSPWDPTATQEKNSAENVDLSVVNDEDSRSKKRSKRSHGHGKDKKHHKKRKKREGNDEREDEKSRRRRRKSKHHEKLKSKAIENTIAEGDIEAFLVKPKDDLYPNVPDVELGSESIKSPVSFDSHDTPPRAEHFPQQEGTQDYHVSDKSHLATQVSSPETSIHQKSSRSRSISEGSDHHRPTSNKSFEAERKKNRDKSNRKHYDKRRRDSHSPRKHRRSRSKSIQIAETDDIVSSRKHEEAERIRHRKRHRRHPSDDHQRSHKSSRSNYDDEVVKSLSHSKSKKSHKRKRLKQEKHKTRKTEEKEPESLVSIHQSKLDPVSSENDDNLELMEHAFNSIQTIRPPDINVTGIKSDGDGVPEKQLSDTVSPDALNVPLAKMDYDLIPVSPNKSSPELMIDTDDGGDVLEDITSILKEKQKLLAKTKKHYASFISPEKKPIVTEIPDTAIVENEASTVPQSSDLKDDLFEDIFGEKEEPAKSKDEFESLVSTTASSFVYSPSHPTSLPSSPQKEEDKSKTTTSTLISNESKPLDIDIKKPKEKLPFMVDSDDEDDIEYQLEKSAEQKRKMELQTSRTNEQVIPLLFDSKPIEKPAIEKTSQNGPKLPLIQDDDDVDVVMSPESDGFEIPLIEPGDTKLPSVDPFQEIMRRKLEQQAKRDKKIEKENEKKTKVTKEHKLVNFLVRQAKVEEEMKTYLKAYYRKKEITKEEYKGILKKAVPQVTMSKSHVIPEKIESLMKKYVCKVKGQRKKYGKATFLY